MFLTLACRVDQRYHKNIFIAYIPEIKIFLLHLFLLKIGRKKVACNYFKIHLNSLIHIKLHLNYFDRITYVTNNFLLLLCFYLNEFDMRQQCENSVKEKWIKFTDLFMRFWMKGAVRDCKIYYYCLNKEKKC